MSSQSPTTRDDYAAYEAKRARGEALEAEILLENKLTLFRTLGAAGIEVVTAYFDGYGDSGQIESIRALDGANIEVDLPREPIPVKDVDFSGTTIIMHEHDARVVIETMAYDLLSRTHGGWENNEGAFGEFVFNIFNQSIVLEFNERIVETEFHRHEF